MDNNSDNSNESRKIRTFFLVVVMLITICAVLLGIGNYYGEKSEAEQEQLRIDTLKKVVEYGNKENDAAVTDFDINLSKEVHLISSFLRDSVTKEGYTGPRVLEHGFIAELQGDKVILPDGVPQGEMQISRELIEDSLKSETMRSGRLVLKDRANENEGEDPVIDGFYLSFGRITDSLIYVDMTTDAEFIDYVQSYTSDGFLALKTAAGMFDGMAMIVSDSGDKFSQLTQYGSIAGISGFSDLGISPETIRSEGKTDLIVNDQSYRCICVKSRGMWLGSDNTYVIQILPLYSLKNEIFVQSVLVCFLMALIFITIAVFLLAEQKYTKENILNGEEIKEHDPIKLRRKMINAGLVGAVVILCVSFLTQAVGKMYQQVRYGQGALQLLSEKYVQNERNSQEDGAKKVQEEWYVRYSREIAGFLEDHPEMATAAKLVEFCEILETDFIMLFDSEGNEVLCSRDYEGFTLDKGLGVNSSDFRRLLQGVDSIVHEPSTDAVTGLERQMIGVKMAAMDDPFRHGVLIMALLPDQTSGIIGMEDWEEETFLLSTKEILCFIADASTGIIQYSGDISMVGKDIKDCGLPDKSLSDGFMDYSNLNGVKRFVLTEKTGNDILFYTVEYKKLRYESLIFSISAALLYALALTVLGIYLMKGYDMKVFREWSVKKIPFKGKANGLVEHLFQWDSRSPGKKASLVFYTGLFIILQLWVKLLLGQKIANDSYGSLLDYLLIGDWMRGFNIFSLCSILMVFAIANLIMTISGWFLHLLGGSLSAKGETICVLVRSIIKYIAIIAVIFISLEYLGVLNSTVIASLGIGSLALSLGAKDVVADILAGIFIVFEETLRVGDIVQYNDKYYTVEEVGMRCTKLLYWPGHSLSINNHEIGSVLNLSKADSFCITDFKVMGSDNLLWIEDILKRELPEINKKCDLFKGNLRYMGVTDLGNGSTGMLLSPTMTLRIGVECEQKNMESVRLFLNREVRLMCEREGIHIL